MGLLFKGEEVNGQTEELVRLAQRGNSVLDSNKSWLPLLTCLLKLNSYGKQILFILLRAITNLAQIYNPARYQVN